MEQCGWPRRLDDRVDQLLKRRLGFGLIGGPEPSLSKEVRAALIGSSVVALVLLVAFMLSDQTDKAAILIGPVVGVALGTVLGRVLRDQRKRQRTRN